MYRLFSSLFGEIHVRQGDDLQFTCYSKIPDDVCRVFIICSQASSLNFMIVYFRTLSNVILLAPILVPQTSKNI